jgi:hypothetical protein
MCATSLNDDKFVHPVIQYLGCLRANFVIERTKMGRFALADVDFLLVW